MKLLYLVHSVISDIDYQSVILCLWCNYLAGNPFYFTLVEMGDKL